MLIHSAVFLHFAAYSVLCIPNSIIVYLPILLSVNIWVILDVFAIISPVSINSLEPVPSGPLGAPVGCFSRSDIAES